MDNPPKYLTPANARDIAALAADMSADHRREVRATGNLSPLAAAEISLAASVEAYAYIPPGRAAPVFAFGVGEAGALTGSALVWMLATPGIARHGAGVLRAARWGIGRAFLATGASCLCQCIPAWYGTGLRFVERLGFSVGGALGDGDGALIQVSLPRVVFEEKKGKPWAIWDRR